MHLGSMLCALHSQHDDSPCIFLQAINNLKNICSKSTCQSFTLLINTHIYTSLRFRPVLNTGRLNQATFKDYVGSLTTLSSNFFAIPCTRAKFSKRQYSLFTLTRHYSQHKINTFQRIVLYKIFNVRVMKCELLYIC